MGVSGTGRSPGPRCWCSGRPGVRPRATRATRPGTWRRQPPDYRWRLTAASRRGDSPAHRSRTPRQRHLLGTGPPLPGGAARGQCGVRPAERQLCGDQAAAHGSARTHDGGGPATLPVRPAGTASPRREPEGRGRRVRRPMRSRTPLPESCSSPSRREHVPGLAHPAGRAGAPATVRAARSRAHRAGGTAGPAHRAGVPAHDTDRAHVADRRCPGTGPAGAP
jgi:hypothetical protein